MSTKSTIVCGPDFHLYQEGGDSSSVYLELEGVFFEASPCSVTVSIPLHIWEFARRFEASELRYADFSDDDVRQFVEREVDERIEKYRRRSKGEPKRWFRCEGMMAFGAGRSQPRDQQISAGLEYYTRMRDHHRNVKQRIAELGAIERAFPQPPSSSAQ